MKKTFLLSFLFANSLYFSQNHKEIVIRQATEMRKYFMEKNYNAYSNVLGDYYIIAVSNDNGKLWKFIDTSGKSIESVRKYFPNLSSKLYIPNKKTTPIISFYIFKVQTKIFTYEKFKKIRQRMSKKYQWWNIKGM